MPDKPPAFEFFTCFNSVQLTGKEATNLQELAKGIETVSGASIFYHTHLYLMKHHFSTKSYGNDFSHWVMDALQEDILAERLANIDIREFKDIRSLRETLLRVIQDHLTTQPPLRVAPGGEAFHFCDAITFYLPTGIIAENLEEFRETLTKVGTPSIYYHFFDARLRLEQNTDDFSFWIEHSLNEPALAKQIRNLDPYRYRLDDLKEKILTLVQKEIDKKEGLPKPLGELFKWLKLN